jgi:amino acid transporter
MVLADDGLLPQVLARRHPRTQVPHVALIVCALAWMLALGCDFERLRSIDVFCYGAALLLEFASLIVLRRREPDLPRLFRIPLDVPGLAVLALAPTSLLLLATLKNLDELRAGAQVPYVLFLMLLVPLVYLVVNRRRPASYGARGPLSSVEAGLADRRRRAMKPTGPEEE